MNRDFVEMLSALSTTEVEFLIVGAHALAAHGYVRSTGDLDIWIRASPENAVRVWSALTEFGAPLNDLTVKDLSSPGTVYQIGLPPTRIDLLTEISGITFEEAWPRRNTLHIASLEVPFIGREDLITNKRATGRLKDLADIEELDRTK